MTPKYFLTALGLARLGVSSAEDHRFLEFPLTGYFLKPATLARAPNVVAPKASNLHAIYKEHL